MRPSCSQVTPPFKRAVGPTGIGWPCVIFTSGSTRLVRSYRSSSRRIAAAITRDLFALSRALTTSNGSSTTGMYEDGGSFGGFDRSCAPAVVATSSEAASASVTAIITSNLIRAVVFIALLSLADFGSLPTDGSVLTFKLGHHVT